VGIQPQLGEPPASPASERRGRATEIFAALRGLRPLARPRLRVRYSSPDASGGEATRIAAFVTTRRRLPAFR
jgi:hypothetical protein